MNEHMQQAMSEALKLTREGRLSEATSVIQASLGGHNHTPGSQQNHQGDVIDVDSTIIDDEKPPEADSGTSRLREAPKWPRAFRDSRSFPHAPTENPPPFSAPGNAVRENGSGASGRFLSRSYSGGVGSGDYKLYVPGGYVGQDVPLVVMLHGCTQSPDDFAAGTRMNALAEKHTFLVAYPAQASGANISKCWNWYEASNQVRGRGEPAVIAGITTEVCRKYRIDDGKVCIAGMSSGGAMAAIMGETYPDLYAAVGVHSGLAPGSANDLASAFGAMRNGGITGRPLPAGVRVPPTIIFHGDRDSTVHPKNAENIITRWKSAAPANVVETKESGRSAGGKAYVRRIYNDEDNASGAEIWTVAELGHAWAGGDGRGSYTDSSGPDASAEMIRFFGQYS